MTYLNIDCPNYDGFSCGKLSLVDILKLRSGLAEYKLSSAIITTSVLQSQKTFKESQSLKFYKLKNDLNFINS